MKEYLVTYKMPGGIVETGIMTVQAENEFDAIVKVVAKITFERIIIVAVDETEKSENGK